MAEMGHGPPRKIQALKTKERTKLTTKATVKATTTTIGYPNSIKLQAIQSLLKQPCVVQSRTCYLVKANVWRTTL